MSPRNRYPVEERAVQMITVLGATALAVTYELVTQHFIKGVSDFRFAPFLWQIGLIGVVAAIGLGFQDLGSKALAPFVDHKKEPPEACVYRVKVLATFALAIQCTFLLGYLTMYTGGTLYSPYAQLLLAMVLLSPVVAESKEAVVLMLIVVLVVFVLFGYVIKDDSQSNFIIPEWNYGFTALATVMISLLNPLFGRQRQVPLEWRWRWKRRLYARRNRLQSMAAKDQSRRVV